MILPGVAAMAASQGLAKPAKAAPVVSKSGLKKLSRTSSFYKVPKSEGKTAKYVSKVAPLLDLTTDQQQQATTIFNDAVMTTDGIRSSLKTARLSLADAVKNGNRGLIEQIAAMIGSLQAQRTAIGANAKAAFFQTLTFEQRSKLTQQPEKKRSL